MIAHHKPNALNLLITLRSACAKRVARRTFMIMLLASIIVLLQPLHPEYYTYSSAIPFTLIGISLSIFMSFRNNICYSRWWEGRMAWGQVVIETRSFIRESNVILHETVRKRLLLGLCGYIHALNARLRNEDELTVIKPWIDDQGGIPPHNIRDGILQLLGTCCSRLAQQGHISEWRYLILEQRLEQLSGAQATCERIKATPLPFPYTLLLHRTIYLFCLLLPFAMAEPLGWLAPLFTTIVSYTFFSLIEISNELEDPFGHEENDLPTDAIVRMLERELLGALEKTPYRHRF